MRLIGHLTEKTSALTFSDFLYVQGIGNEVESEKEGWAIWILGEDEVPRARELLEQYKTNPADPRYKKSAAQAENLKVQERLSEEDAKDRYFDKSRVFRETRSYRIGPLTVALVLVCVGVTIAGATSNHFFDLFYITQFEFRGSQIVWLGGLPEIMHGQVWRLITPIFIHAGAVHLIFNSLAMLDLGSMVESRRGSLRLLVLVIVLAIVSNLAQYWIELPTFKDFSLKYLRGTPNFCGISGVAFGLMGYIWMKSRFDPDSGFFLNRQAVTMMMVWFAICFAGVLPVNFANTAHTAGLLMGMGIGYGSSLLSRRRRRT
jgi:rhomboid protease GlpG